MWPQQQNNPQQLSFVKAFGDALQNILNSEITFGNITRPVANNIYQLVMNNIQQHATNIKNYYQQLNLNNIEQYLQSLVSKMIVDFKTRMAQQTQMNNNMYMNQPGVLFMNGNVGMQPNFNTSGVPMMSSVSNNNSVGNVSPFSETKQKVEEKKEEPKPIVSTTTTIEKNDSGIKIPKLEQVSTELLCSKLGVNAIDFDGIQVEEINSISTIKDGFWINVIIIDKVFNNIKILIDYLSEKIHVKDKIICCASFIEKHDLNISVENLTKLQNTIKLFVNDIRILEKTVCNIEVTVNEKDAGSIKYFILKEINKYINNGLFADIVGNFYFDTILELLNFIKKYDNIFKDCDIQLSDSELSFIRKRIIELTSYVLRSILHYKVVNTDTGNTKIKKNNDKNISKMVIKPRKIIFIQFIDEFVKEKIVGNYYDFEIQRDKEDYPLYYLLHKKSTDFANDYLSMQDDSGFILPFQYVKNQSGFYLKYIDC